MLLKLDETRFKRTQIQMQYAIMANQAEHVDEDEELEKSTDSNINKKSLKKQ